MSFKILSTPSNSRQSHSHPHPFFKYRASAFGQSANGAIPGHISPWTKFLLEWAIPNDITNDGVYTLRASELYNDYFTISAPYDEGEYLVIENRQPLLFDAPFFGGGGIVIYKVNENTGNFGNRNRGGPFQAGWPGNGNFFMVSVLQADGRYDLEQGVNNGDAGDLWRPGQSLGPGNGELEANTADYPNTDGYSNGQVKVTGLSIDSFTEVESGVWSFRVSGLGGGNPTNAPAPFSPPTASPVASPTDSSGGSGPTVGSGEPGDGSGGSHMILSGAIVVQALLIALSTIW